MKNPLQPLFLDGQETLRFKANNIVRYLLDKGVADLNHLAEVSYLFSQDDQEQFAQLIGYSLSGFCELSYVSDETCEKAKSSVDVPRLRKAKIL
ncbi:MAG: hypothetical protein HOG49_15115 [Candidatus Scalindua sp.]|jgi:hypothetical protein|nr:hypothetical protein [Candidatus Scalindua sp.]